jgi:hypothetical protein
MFEREDLFSKLGKFFDKKEVEEKEKECCFYKKIIIDYESNIEICKNCGVVKKYEDKELNIINFGDNSLYKKKLQTWSRGSKYNNIKRGNLWINHIHENKIVDNYYQHINDICNKLKIKENHIIEIKYIYKSYYIDRNLNESYNKKKSKRNKIEPSRGKIRIILYLIAILIILIKYKNEYNICYIKDLILNKNLYIEYIMMFKCSKKYLTIDNFNYGIKKVKNIDIFINKNIIEYKQKILDLFNINLKYNDIINVYNIIYAKKRNTNSLLFGSIYILIKDKILITDYCKHIKISQKKIKELINLYNNKII